jgi:hypothetical protein
MRHLAFELGLSHSEFPANDIIAFFFILAFSLFS